MESVDSSSNKAYVNPKYAKTNESGKVVWTSDNLLWLFLVTWNVADKGPPCVELSTLLRQNRKYKPDVVAVGLQELDNPDEWQNAISNVMFSNDYVLIKVRNLWAIWLWVFVKRHHLPAVQNIESETTASGYAGVMGNKGGVSIRMDLYGINFIIVNAHFTAHLTENHERIEDFMDIINKQKFKDPDVDKLLDHDFVFWMGDLNFRIDDLDIDYIKRKVVEKNYAYLLEHDQLTTSKNKELIFSRFYEGEIDFPPTYKFDVGTNMYDTSAKKRKPAWTDRILYMINEDNFETMTLGINLQEYSSIPQYMTSDHKPVYALYSLKCFDKAPSMPVFFDVPDIISLKAVENNNYKFKFKYSVNFECKQSFRISSWGLNKDWIGIYPHDFPTFTCYLTYIYPSTSDKKQLEKGVCEEISIENAKKGMYRLIYFSASKNCPVGYSELFTIIP